MKPNEIQEGIGNGFCLGGGESVTKHEKHSAGVVLQSTAEN